MIDLNVDQLERARQMLGHIPGAAPKAMARAINRAAATAKTEASRKIRETYYISGKNVSDVIKVARKASASDPVAIIRVRSGPIALSKFKVTPKNPPKKRGKTVVARVKKGSGGEIAHAFVARMESGHVGVFNRVSGRYMRGHEPRARVRGAGRTKGRQFITQRYGPSVAQMAGESSVTRHIEQKAIGKLDERLTHEINRILGANT